MCIGDANGDAAVPNPVTPLRAQAGAVLAVPMRTSMAIAGNQRIRWPIAQSLGRLPLETILPAPMAPDLGKTAALSIVDQSTTIRPTLAVCHLQDRARESARASLWF